MQDEVSDKKRLTVQGLGSEACVLCSCVAPPYAFGWGPVEALVLSTFDCIHGFHAPKAVSWAPAAGKFQLRAGLMHAKHASSYIPKAQTSNAESNSTN